LIVGSFRQYDYGFIKNVFKYGNNKPPEYNLAAVTSPVSMIVGPNDWLATPEVSKSYSHLLYSRGLQTFFE
jgi:lysosomal acid lipase/cholesteryl ester hydrolase